jgi:cyclopropane-fatty-acyl-phospholipid synthase
MSLYTSRLLNTPTTHRQSVARSLDDIWAFTSEVLIRWSWTPLCALARQEIVRQVEFNFGFSLSEPSRRTLSTIACGKITVYTSDGTMHFGSDNSQLHTELSVKSPTFWTRVAMFKDLGFAEAFMYGEGTMLQRVLT